MASPTTFGVALGSGGVVLVAAGDDKTFVELPQGMLGAVTDWRTAAHKRLGLRRVTFREVVVILFELLLDSLVSDEPIPEDDPRYMPPGYLAGVVRARIAAKHGLAPPPIPNGPDDVPR